MILIGSRALVFRAPKLIFREPKDFDFVCSKSECDKWLERNSAKINPTKIYSLKNKVIAEGETPCEFEIIEPGTSNELLADFVEKDSQTINTAFGKIPNLDLLFALKASHRYLKNSPHFWKTLVDYHVMKSVGAKIRPEHQEFFKLREKETYTYLHPKLNVTKDDFFKDDNISYKFDHDTVHESVMRFEKPAYCFYLKDNEPVLCDKNKFFSIDHKYRIAGVVEEAAVLAIERSLVPHPGVWTPEYAWKFALSKVCSSITSGWFREFAYENAFEVLKNYPVGYWEKFEADVKSGLVKPFMGSKYE